MRIVFMGTPEFSLESLKALCENGHDVRAVFTQADKPKGRGHKMVPPCVKVYAESQGIPVYQPLSLRKGEDGEKSFEILKEINPEMIVVVAYGQILPKRILDLPKYGCVNIHASLLPQYRGAAPIERAVLDGQKVTGVTSMYMGEGLDTGDMILKKETEIGSDETGAALRQRLAKLGADILLQTLEKIKNGEAEPKKQDDKMATYAAKITKEMSELDFSNDAASLHNCIRAISGYTFLDSKRLKVFASKIIDKDSGKAPGTVVEGERRLIVSTGDKKEIEFLEVQPEGKKRMMAADFLRGKKIEPGTVFGK